MRAALDRVASTDQAEVNYSRRETVAAKGAGRARAGTHPRRLAHGRVVFDRSRVIIPKDFEDGTTARLPKQ